MAHNDYSTSARTQRRWREQLAARQEAPKPERRVPWRLLMFAAGFAAGWLAREVTKTPQP